MADNENMDIVSAVINSDNTPDWIKFNAKRAEMIREEEEEKRRAVAEVFKLIRSAIDGLHDEWHFSPNEDYTERRIAELELHFAKQF